LNSNSETGPDKDKLLEQQRLFYERILNNISADIVVLDNKYKFLFVSPGAMPDARTRDWLIGKTDEEYFKHKNTSTTIAERRMKMYDTARDERRVIKWVERSVDVTGNIRHTLRKIHPVFDDNGNLDIIIGYSMNISEMIAVQEELKTSRDTFESAFHDSGIGMAMLSPDGKWLDANKAMCEITGYGKEQLMQIHVRDITHHEERRENKELVKKMLQREMPNFTRERRYISKHGKIVYTLFTLSLVWGKNDEPKFFIAQAVDITKMKELELENVRKNSELEATKVHLQNKVSQLEELSYIIAHNLRGPAANIKLLTDALLAQTNSDSPEGKLRGAFTVEEGLTFIQDASTSLMNSLASLMKIAEVKLNKNVPVVACDVEGVVNEVMTQLQSAMFEKQAKISLSLDVKIIHYPKAYLESILYNFISNALKYHRSGVPPDITICTKMENDKVQLSVRDNGLGIDMERHGDKIFKLNQVFHAGHDSKGFGLYLTKTQVESLGGNISVESKPDEGTEFVVTL
jgi:PAS domain S-box-containing protein